MLESATTQAACQGCCINPLWTWNPCEPYRPLTLQSTLDSFKIRPAEGLTDDEKAILQKLVEVFNMFSALDRKSNADTVEFTDAIHRAQQLIALRVARRVDTEVWHQPE